MTETEIINLVEPEQINDIRLSLSELIIAWLQQHPEACEEKKQQVYYAFYITNEILKGISNFNNKNPKP